MGKKRFSVQKQQMGRRTLLRGVFGGAATVAVGLPMLDIMLDDNGTAYADGSELPCRFGTFYWGGGILHSAWVPGTTGRGYELPFSLEPFAGVRDYVSLITGTNHANSSPGHIPSRGIALSSSHSMDTSIEGVGTYRDQRHPEPSIDALIAEQWSGATPYDLLAVGICRRGPYASNSSWGRGGTSYNRHEPSPQALFDRLFAGRETPEPSEGLLDATTAFERSMLDAVREDTLALQGRIGASDRRRLEQHLEGIRALERRLQDVNMGTACTDGGRPMRSDFGDGSTREDKEPKAQLMSQILAHALACDLTRVFSYEFSGTQSTTHYHEIGIDEEHHEYNHQNKTGEGIGRITRFIMQNFAYLAEQLRDMPEAGSNVLDRTVIMGTSELAIAGQHNYTDHPYIFVGGAGLERGFHYRHNGGNSSPRCLLTAAHAVGVNLPQIGQADSSGPRVATEPFSELLA